MMADFSNQEKIDKVRYEEARESGKIEKERQMAERLIKYGKMALEEIEDCTSFLMIDDLKQIKAEIGEDKKKLTNPIFEELFSDKKYLLRLYRDLHPEDEKATVDDIADVTLDQICDDYDEHYWLYIYLGFKVGSRVVLLLTLPRWTDDCIRRALKIMPDTYKRLMESSRQNMCENDKLELAISELYIVYANSSTEEIPKTLSLAGECFNIKNIPLHENVAINVLSQSDDKTIIGQYIFFSRTFDHQSNRYGYTKQAIRNTLDECKKKNILTEYIEGREQKLTEILFDSFPIEDVVMSRIRAKEGEARYQEGKERAEIEHGKKIAENFIKGGKLSLEEIQEVTKVSMDELKQIEAKVKANKNI